MLDSDTKRRIDCCRDILVGKVPDPKSQVEQMTIADRQFLNQRRQTPEFGARTAAESLKAVLESSDVEHFGWILKEV